MMLRSLFYVFKNNFQKQTETEDNGSVEVKTGGPRKNTREMLPEKSLFHIKFAK